MAKVFDVSPYDVQIGDRILGTNLIVTGKPHVKTSVIADGVEYRADAFYGASGGWSVPIGERELTYGADRKVSVVRGD